MIFYGGLKMINRSKFLMVILLVVCVLFVACENDSNESNNDLDNQSSESSSNENVNDDSATDMAEDMGDGNTTENVSGNQANNQEDDAVNQDAHTNNEESPETIHNDNEGVESEKEAYLKKLNGMEEADRNGESGETTSELEEQEEERFKKWDVELNEIYGVLEEQLSTEEMEKLREEQRDWVESRDETAKEASLKYEGGASETLEYVATQASLTRERCYTLVARYMQ